MTVDSNVFHTSTRFFSKTQTLQQWIVSVVLTIYEKLPELLDQWKAWQDRSVEERLLEGVGKVKMRGKRKQVQLLLGEVLLYFLYADALYPGDLLDRQPLSNKPGRAGDTLCFEASLKSFFFPPKEKSILLYVDVKVYGHVF